MLIMISSSSTNLYKSDVIRTLAYPSGTIIQYRYDKKWIECPSAITPGRQVILCYLDAKDYTLIPIRIAQIQSVDVYERLFFIKLRVLDYARLIEKEELLGDKLNILPSKKNNTGKFVIDIYNIYQDDTNIDNDKKWFSLVERLYECPDMKDLDYFYRIFPLKDTLGNIVEFDQENGFYILSSENHYLFKILNYHPDKQSQGTIIIDQTFMSKSSCSDIEIDSRYDLSPLSIRTEPSYFTEKFGYYKINCKLNDDLNIGNTFNFKIETNMLIKFTVVLTFTVIATVVSSLIDNKEGVFNWGIAVQYFFISCLIVFVQKVIDFFECFPKLIKNCLNKIKSKLGRD